MYIITLGLCGCVFILVTYLNGIISGNNNFKRWKITAGNGWTVETTSNTCYYASGICLYILWKGNKRLCWHS